MEDKKNVVDQSCHPSRCQGGKSLWPRSNKEQNIEQTLDNTTSDENQTEETTTDFSDVIDARINAAIDEWSAYWG
ncbi:uncharacterized protein E5676_scaffold5463G00010 [Cucumis melo var. makuwa]|uniref:Uncharacterized protein n=1 Tax=Cucumis melo var. makuwa TaxID=1194695 RepID=A0A5D3CC24_CUCMM|nr:uncharacterized protein E6C27_scaffold455G00770 [Cucumis melo var. makuwa]TYK09371.1 uncharacterized protein E5676_scaffold5463G00010 [Cucumis melo var. makuwa]